MSQTKQTCHKFAITPFVTAAQFCKTMYREIVRSDTGRIVWTYLKPLLVGKIPYAPNTPETRAIMEEVGTSTVDDNRQSETWKVQKLVENVYLF